MWNNIDTLQKENDSLDITAFMSLLHVTGYCGDLDGENTAEPLSWNGGAPVSEESELPIQNIQNTQKEGKFLKKIGAFWKENGEGLVGCAMFSCFIAAVAAVRLIPYV